MCIRDSNVADSEADSVKKLLADEQVSTTPWYPMVRGRLVAINGEAISRERMSRSDGLSREVNFTQTTELPIQNQIVAGEWWQGPPANLEFSMEEQVAQEIGVVVGDDIEFSIGGIKLTAKLASIRSVNWQSMTPNFYVVFYPGALDK